MIINSYLVINWISLFIRARKLSLPSLIYLLLGPNMCKISRALLSPLKLFRLQSLRLNAMTFCVVSSGWLICSIIGLGLINVHPSILLKGWNFQWSSCWGTILGAGLSNGPPWTASWRLHSCHGNWAMAFSPYLAAFTYSISLHICNSIPFQIFFILKCEIEN